jgi:hypothetical protein
LPVMSVYLPRIRHSGIVLNNLVTKGFERMLTVQAVM